MNPMSDMTHTAFEGNRHIASGDLAEVARAAKAALDRNSAAAILVFDNQTGRPVDLDFRGSAEDVVARLPQQTGASVAETDTATIAARGPGRPKLGVVAREVTLLPRHWEWLARQSGGASVAIRKLVEEARRAGEGNDRRREAQEAVYRFMSAMAGNQPHYEEAIRALFAGDIKRFEASIGAWPADLRDHSARLAATAFDREALPLPG